MYSEFRIVLRRNGLEKSVANGCQIFQERTIPSFCRQQAGSATPCRTHASNTAGNPPMAYIVRHPKRLPIE